MDLLHNYFSPIPLKPFTLVPFVFISDFTAATPVESVHYNQFFANKNGRTSIMTLQFTPNTNEHVPLKSSRSSSSAVLPSFFINFYALFRTTYIKANASSR